ncbi:prepilin-type N-terminal cleavage/methylation domain-containing protein [Thiorhodococcus mannitoliphagus]|uniref:Prepilin-type N-terminal cleavage/methylation domain-containing protein n=1 Tax=Thiorhodococcus mannitoliphagus TaxID=329406 RepID=A0A6P1DLD5_9GAMM|nr:prepilin-type N-terminal cleavage/methylation domain-containing protein [Thiorhodococcus mannitoliphagus]NEX18739.1 prepilin-type N-terminal cleavage/methylation domain-containing protein [Thiorhodococcus mannitoliphagus]
MSAGARHQAGFSLLEVLVAFAILALSLGVMMEIFSRASIVTIASAQYSQAATLAESVLGEVGADIPLEEGVVSGATDSGFEWELSIQAVDVSDQYFTEPPATPYRIDATVLWKDAGRARRVSLTTLRLGERL